MIILRLFMVMFLAILPICNVTLDGGIIDDILFAKPKTTAPTTIKVLVAHDKPGVVFEVKGKYKIYDPKDASHITTRFIGKRRYLQALNDGLEWGEQFPGVYQLLFVSASPATTMIVDGIEYKGSIYIYDIGGSISVVNEIDIEEYISSLLSPQYQDSLPSETMAAVVIAARTKALYEVTNPASQYFSIDGSKVGYQGCALANPYSPLERAIEATRHMVMSREKGATIPFPATWGPAGTSAAITVQDAEHMATSGEHAAKILGKAFPGINIQYVPGKY